MNHHLFSHLERLALILAYTFLLNSPVTYGQSPSSEEEQIRQEMDGLEGAELLQAHSNLCRLAAAGNDPIHELACIHDFIREAILQNDTDAEGLARSSLIYCWYNYDMDDSLTTELPHHLAAMRKNKTWDYYYNSWSALVDNYIYRGKLMTALAEAEKMYGEARKNDRNYGIGVAGYCVGQIYQTMGRLEEARKALEESISALEKEEDISLLLSTYNILGEVLDSQGEYTLLDDVCRNWKAVLDDYQRKAEAAGYTPSLGGRYLYCTLSSAIAHIGQQELEEAEKEIRKAEEYAEGRKSLAQHKMLLVKARYYAAAGNFEEAIRCNDQNMKLLAAAEDTISLHNIEMQQAAYLLENGNYKESAELYHRIRPFHDRLRNQELGLRLDELQTLYEVDKLELENKGAKNLFYYTLLVCLLLLIVIGLYIRFNKKLTKKNKLLYQTLLQLQKTEQEGIPAKGEDFSGKEATLYHRLCQLMEEKKLYTRPELQRDVLAEELGTNRTYLAKAVKIFHHGSTINEFINDMRLRNAASMLSEHPEKNINEIEEASGFNSRTTFTRLFREHYGMTPSEYRNISKEHKVQ